MTRYNVVGIGNAIVDVVACVSTSFVEASGLSKGCMVLIDEPAAERLYASIGSGKESSGGSAANTIAGLASLGATCAFLGKVRQDRLGDTFSRELRALGVAFPTAPLQAGPATARCLILVTQDAQRTMGTFLGASAHLTPADVDAQTIRDAAITYLEGYLFDPPQAKDAFRQALSIARAAGNQVALTLSDPFCVERHRADFLDLLHRGVDILFANEIEMTALIGSSEAREVQARLAPHCGLVAVTRSERGSTLITPDDVVDVAPVAFGPVLDTTGAGDLYASGLLCGLVRGLPLRECGALASLCAAEAISHYGARPTASLEALAGERGINLDPRLRRPNYA